MYVARVSKASTTGLTCVVMVSTAAIVPPGLRKRTWLFTPIAAELRVPAALRMVASEAAAAGDATCMSEPICVSMSAPELP